MTVRQKLGIILENKVVQKLKLENNTFNKKNGLLCKLIFLNDFLFVLILMIFYINNQLSKYKFEPSFIGRIFYLFPMSMLILGQKSYFLGPAIFEIPQLNWY